MRLHRVRFLTIFICFAAIACAGCRPRREFVIPDKATAKDQYRLALMEVERARDYPVRPEKRPTHFRRPIATFEKVLERFPDDPTYTPLSVLEIATIHLDDLNDPKRALKHYKWVYVNATSEDYFQAQSLVQMGLCYEALDKPVKANELYLECMDIYEGHPSDFVKQQVERAVKLYNRVK